MAETKKGPTDPPTDTSGPVKTVRFKEGDVEPDPNIENENNENEDKPVNEGPLREVKNCKHCDLCRSNWRPKVAINVSSVVTTRDNLSRPQIMRWLNDCLEDQMTCIEELGRGTIYCSLMEMLFPRSVSYIDIRFHAVLVRDYIHNFNLLQSAFRKVCVNKQIPIMKLVQCRLQDNLEFVLWFKKFFDANDKGHKFCELTNRSSLDKKPGKPSTEEEEEVIKAVII